MTRWLPHWVIYAMSPTGKGLAFTLTLLCVFLKTRKEPHRRLSTSHRAAQSQGGSGGELPASTDAVPKQCSGTGSPAHQTPGARKPTFSFILGILAYDRQLRGDPYDPQRPSVLECGGSEGRSTSPLHSRSLRGYELNYRSSTPTFGSTTNLQHFRFPEVNSYSSLVNMTAK